MLPAFLAVIVTLVPAGVDLELTPTGSRSVSEAWQRMEGLSTPTPRTLETLRRLDLSESYRSDPENTLLKLELFARRAVDPELVFALAELSWIEARRNDRRRRAQTLDRYVDAVAYAYDFLLDPDLAAGRNPADPRFRQAIDFYNAGLERLIEGAQANGEIQPGGTMELAMHSGAYKIAVVLPDSPWNPEDVDELILASRFELTGLPTRSKRFGLGVPLIGIRHSKDHPDAAGPDAFFAKEVSFPLTAFLRPQSRLKDNAGEVTKAREVTLDLVDTVRWQTLTERPDLPIEADLTIPLAYMFSRSDLKQVSWTGLFRPAKVKDSSGLTLIRPYEPGKIPVVMVHGLWSSPLAWIPMLNELQRDPQITSRYQFLLYLYPTGVPLPIAASGLRESLVEFVRQVDPQGTDLALQQMVLLGHSMGGLLSHAMAVDSGDQFWYLMSDRPFDQIIGDPQILAELRRYLYFNHLPFVRRVVFLATPHRGSDLSRKMVGRMGSGLIDEPDEIEQLFRQLLKDNRDAFDPRQFRRLPTSIDTLDPNSGILSALLGMRPGPGVTFHSIIGNNRPGPRDTGTDGVVPFSSAYFQDAESTRVVRSDHGVQKDPEAILEVHRILYQHAGLDQSRVATAPIDVISAPVREAFSLPR